MDAPCPPLPLSRYPPPPQSYANVGLGAAYGAISLVALVQLARIQLRVPGLGWTTQKARARLAPPPSPAHAPPAARAAAAAAARARPPAAAAHAPPYRSRLRPRQAAPTPPSRTCAHPIPPRPPRCSTC